jgi:thymidylate synthase (FAD)
MKGVKNMKVELIAISKPEVDGINTAEELVAYCARVSNPSNQVSNQNVDKLIRYCIKNQHWSIFEMVNITISISTTRDIARQILRHRSFAFQEFSQRYADPTKDLGFELREARLQDTKNRQNSIETDDENIKELWEERQASVIYRAKEAYEWAIENGIAKEQARAVLPEGNTQSRMYMNGTLRSWIHYCELRRANGTQKEHMEIADKCWKIITEKFPNVARALEQQ